jgi:predicted RNase H-like HicB family nuclease
MLSEYLRLAMRRAHYEFLDEREGFSGEIRGFEGVLAQGATLEECREELASTLEDWLLFRISRHLAIPVIDGMNLEIKEVAGA